MYRENLGKNLRAARKKRKLTQQVAADFLNIQQCTLSKYENSKLEPDVETICKMAVFYGVSADWLFGIDNAGKNE